MPPAIMDIRARDLMSRQASTGPSAGPVFAGAGKTSLHLIFILSQTSAGKRQSYIIARPLFWVVPLFVPMAVPSFSGLRVGSAPRAGAVKAGVRGNLCVAGASKPRLV
jgi:hypothetical protein